MTVVPERTTVLHVSLDVAAQYLVIRLWDENSTNTEVVFEIDDDFGQSVRYPLTVVSKGQSFNTWDGNHGERVSRIFSFNRGLQRRCVISVTIVRDK